MKTIIALVVSFLVCSSAFAFTSQKYGNTEYFQTNNGDSGTVQTYGSTSYINTNSGGHAVCSSYGNQTYCN
jgi:uncharacterized protein YxeA